MSQQFLREDVPISALFVADSSVVARFYNPTTAAKPFLHEYKALDVAVDPVADTTSMSQIAAKQIVTTQLTVDVIDEPRPPASCSVLNLPIWRVSNNAGLPDEAILADLAARSSRLEAEANTVHEQFVSADGNAKLRLEHRYYVLKREALEYQLSHLLNRRKLAQDGSLDYAYLYEFDPDIAEVGLALNRLRIKRRIYDYVVQVLD